MASTSRRTERSASDGPVRVCVDRIVPPAYQPARSVAERSILDQIRSANAPVLRAIDAAGVIPHPRAAIVLLKRWEPGQTLRCRFLDGSATQQRKVIEKAEIWEQHANINFRFVKRGDAEIRISFGADPGSWSAVGTDALVERYFPKYQPTMNFGWLRDDTDDQECERVVVHEFGHALGLIHEHQNPNARLNWDTAAVYRYFSGPPNFWSRQDIDFNVLQRYSPNGIGATDFDDQSIMLYQFDASLFRDHRATPLNFQLSPKDKDFVARMYPRSA